MVRIKHYCLATTSSLNGEIELVEGETVREFSLRLLDKMFVGHDGITNPCSFTSKKLMSLPADKNKPVAEFLDIEKGIYVNSLLNPNVWARHHGNLRADNFEPDVNTCPICLQDYQLLLSDPKERLLVLTSCGHRIHAWCLYKTDDNMRCPICRQVINIDDLGNMLDMISPH